MVEQNSRAAVVGAGIVGLSVAWFLQQEGFDVTVFYASGVAAGASAGNAEWITPGMVSPLPEPGVVGYALRSLFRRDSPLRVTPAALPWTARFLASFALNYTPAKWNRGVERLAGMCGQAMSSYEALARGGVMAELGPAPIVIAFADAAEALHRSSTSRKSPGQPGRHTECVSSAPVSCAGASRPLRASAARPAPGGTALPAAAVVHEEPRRVGPVARRANQIRCPSDRVEPASGGTVSVAGAGEGTAFDVVVLANGAWLRRLGKSAGVRIRLAAGRGYSFTVKTAMPVAGPLYLPSLRVACTPAPGGMRLAGTMEFRSADAPLDRRRIDAIVRSAEDYLDGVDWDSMSGLWVGPRPLTADGLPVIGATKLPGVYAAGGHGMWGMTLGPATGRLLAEYIAEGERPAELRHFDPCR
jgi:D-amino-acid dehydrogenase